MLPGERPVSDEAFAVRGDRDARASWFTWASQTPTATSEPGSRRSGVATAAVHYEPSTEIEQLICSVFTEDCAHAVRVAKCESGLNPLAHNPSGASGVFQIMMPLHAGMFEAHGWSPDDVYDAYRNTVVAHDLWESNGWRAWTCR